MEISNQQNIENAFQLCRDNKHKQGLEIYQEIYRKNPEEFDDKYKKSFAWAIYNIKIKENKKPEELKAATLFITNLVNQKDLHTTVDREKTCPYTTAILTASKHLTEKGEYYDALRLCDKLNIEYLSRTHHIGKNGDENPSKLEMWYLRKSKALIESHEYDQTLKLTTKALESIEKPIQSSNVWFKYRRAKANNGLGNYDEAIKDLEEILEIKQDWYFYRELAISYYFKEDDDKYFENLINAALVNKKANPKKTRLFEEIGDYLREKKAYGYSQKHYYLTYIIKNSQGDYTNNIAEKLDKTNFDLNNKNPNELYNELREFWLEQKYGEKQNGLIIRLFKKSGLIEGADYNTYYYSNRDLLGNPNDFKINKTVTFYKTKSYDQKKQQESNKAVYIRLK